MKTTVIVHNNNWISKGTKPYMEIISDKIESEEDLKKFIESLQGIEVQTMLKPRIRRDYVKKINA